MKTDKIKENTGEKIYVGLDVHKKSWQVTIMTDYSIHKSFSQPPSPETLANYLNVNFKGGIYYSWEVGRLPSQA